VPDRTIDQRSVVVHQPAKNPLENSATGESSRKQSWKLSVFVVKHSTPPVLSGLLPIKLANLEKVRKFRQKGATRRR